MMKAHHILDIIARAAWRIMSPVSMALGEAALRVLCKASSLLLKGDKGHL